MSGRTLQPQSLVLPSPEQLVPAPAPLPQPAIEHSIFTTTSRFSKIAGRKDKAGRTLYPTIKVARLEFSNACCPISEHRPGDPPVILAQSFGISFTPEYALVGMSTKTGRHWPLAPSKLKVRIANEARRGTAAPLSGFGFLRDCLGRCRRRRTDQQCVPPKFHTRLQARRQ